MTTKASISTTSEFKTATTNFMLPLLGFLVHYYFTGIKSNISRACFVSKIYLHLHINPNLVIEYIISICGNPTQSTHF